MLLIKECMMLLHAMRMTQRGKLKPFLIQLLISTTLSFTVRVLAEERNM